MKEKEIERALEIVYFNPDKFKLIDWVDYHCIIQINNRITVAFYNYPDTMNMHKEFAELIHYDNRR